MLLSTRAVLALSLALAACGGGDDDGDDGSSEQFLGTYQVTSHRENHQQGDPVPCSDPGPEIQPGEPLYAPVFALVVDPFFEDPDVLVFQTCEEGGTGCVDSLITLDRIGDRLEATFANTQTSGEGTCSLHAGLSSFTLDDDVATLEDRSWYEFDHQGSCTTAAAEAMVGGPDCRDVVIWVGTRL